MERREDELKGEGGCVGDAVVADESEVEGDWRVDSIHHRKVLDPDQRC